MRNIKCKNCKEIKTEKGTYKCHNCNLSGCRNCVKLTCCDCGVSMCKDCRDDNNILCGCYGNCSSCDTDVNRGEHGWPCNKCKKWYCNECRNNSKCKQCND